jgi:RNA polymerase sigma factor (TIGR02999 family)
MNRAEATLALAEATTGDASADERVWTLVYGELHRIAHRELASEAVGHTLSTTALVHEAYFKLVDHEHTARRDRAYFYALACRAMRQVLVDHARQRNALKRHGRWRRVTLDEGAGAVEPDADDLVALDEALTRLADFNERLGRVVELRFYGGLSTREVAEMLGVDVRTIERDWLRAKAYLYRMLEMQATEG